MRRARVLRAALFALLLGGCATVNEAPVEERSTTVGSRTAAPRGSEHVVVAGDTLYGVAFRHGLDYRRLAAWNDIPSPYTIQPGQRLRLVAPDQATATGTEVVAARDPDFDGPTRTYAAADAPAATPAPLTIEPLPEDDPVPPATGLPATSGARAPPVAAAPAGPVSAAIGDTAPSRPATPASAALPPPAPPMPPAVAPPAGVPLAIAKAPTQSVAGVSWRWPADGRVTNRYVAGDPARQGVDILGREGQAVTAAADGEVVYSGNGLLGYGELVIIKHSGDFLSAYGHNRRRLVAEGARVKGGQPIAEMGKGGGVERLHFEIRRDGKPVDPLAYLPRR